MPDEPLLTIDDLTVSFPQGKGQRLRAADGVSMAVHRGQTLAVVGESGSGKSVTAMTVLQLIPTPPGSYDGGRVLWQRRENWPAEDLLRCDDRAMRKIRGGEIAMIFQEPMTSLNPVYTIGDQIVEAISLHQRDTEASPVDIAVDSLRAVGIADPKQRLSEYPHQLSGGMRQRVMIAMALACEPRLLLADEPTTALDVTIQAQILELLREIQSQRGMGMMLITHDLGVVAENADVVAVMYGGRVCEFTDVVTLFENPMHPYTRGLLGSMPVIGKTHGRLLTVADGSTVPEGLPAWLTVHPHRIELPPGERYGGPAAQLYEIEPGHWVLGEASSESAEAKKAATPPRLSWTRREQVAAK
ncbi:MAG: ABC transporter ATP-binding protein [Phycisphaeraceae bacterium]